MLLEVDACESWRAYDNAADLTVRIVVSEEVLELRDDFVEEFVFSFNVLIVVTRCFLRDIFCDLLLKHCFVCSDHEDVSDALFHGDCNDVTLVLLFDHLIEPLHVDAVEFLLNNRD